VKKISIFGSTGTVGRKAVDVVCNGDFEVVVLSGNRNAENLIEQALKIQPQYVCVTDDAAFKKVRDALAGSKTKVIAGTEIAELARLNVDCCFMAISGDSGLLPTFECLGYAKRLAIASKEVILLGGNLLVTLAKKHCTKIIPVDSEHNAVFQCINCEDKGTIEEMILTASGGAFSNYEENELENVSVRDALKHPNWTMGQKITVDSSTLINKAFEIIEAAYLFEFPVGKIVPLLHANSIIHGLVKFIDKSFKAILSFPDMLTPISFSINYPNRVSIDKLPEVNFAELGNLSFGKFKSWQKRNIDLAYHVFHDEKVIAFAVADEIAVTKFINNEIGFNEIYGTIMKILDVSDGEKIGSIEDIVNTIFTVKQRSAEILVR
jgi:1-deoxy-D-xylulose-5-phosphate reductoisomerase